MRIGLGLPQIGPFAKPAAVREVATAAEGAGFASLWAVDRIMAPLEPRTPYALTADGHLPEEHRVVLDPIGVLTLAAAVTERVRVGTNVLVAPWYPPVLMARSLSTLDHISGGRLDIGLGLGWSADEFAAAGVSPRNLGARAEEILDVLDNIWSRDPVSVTTSREQIAPCFMRPKPLQCPGPPLLLAAYTQTGLDRVARRADGWTPVGLPLSVVAQMWRTVQELTESHGRDPGSMRLVVRANVAHTPNALAGSRPPFSGSTTQIRDDMARIAEMGAAEVILDLQATTSSPDELLELACTLAAPAFAGLAR